MLYTLVSKDNLSIVIDKLKSKKVLACDTETYGLRYFDRMFSLIIGDDEEVFYFNLLDYSENSLVFNSPHFFNMPDLNELMEVFRDDKKMWVFHNAPFDLHRLWLAGVNDVKGIVYDTAVMARYEYNQHLKYNLDACLKRIGLEKDDEVSKYVSKHRLYTKVKIDGKKKTEKLLHYDKVPFETMFKYACMDVEGTFKLYKTQEMEDSHIKLESDISKICAMMYQRGVSVDKDYARACWEDEEKRIETIKQEIEELSGKPFENKSVYFATILKEAGETIKLSEANNPIVDKNALKLMTSPIANLIKEYRRASKYVQTYYSTMLHESQVDGLIHPSFKSMGAATGRFSSSYQQMPKNENAQKGDFETRKCLVPRLGYGFASIDFQAQEARLMLDYAGEHRLIKMVMNGHDLHQATADMCGITRKQAKTVNFGLLYGVGIKELSVMLGVSLNEAKHIKNLYFKKLPKVKKLIEKVKSVSKSRGYVKTITGRKVYLPRFKNYDFSYKMSNHLIQGSSSDIVKNAMVLCQNYIEEKNLDIGIVMTIHDEIVFEIRKDLKEEAINLKEIMKHSYKPINGMYMDCSVEWSTKSLGKQDIEDIF